VLQLRLEWLLVSGFSLVASPPASNARSLRAQPDGKVLITDGPYLETKELIGSFWVLEAANLDDALACGRKAAVACRAPVEVRPFGRTAAREAFQA
jgi:hypothetical protein